MSSGRLRASQVYEVNRRQSPPRWGPSYVPAIKAVKGEAPGVSRVSTLHSARFQREVHALSTPESLAIALALYQDALFELKEQHLLTPWPSDHPMVGHPRATHLTLPTTSGTVAIAERLGLLGQHPRVLDTRTEGDRTIETWIPAG